MDLTEIKHVIELMKRYDLTEFEIEEEGLKLRLNRHQFDKNHPIFANPGAMMPMALPGQGMVTPPADAPASSASSEAEEEANAIYIRSPMVGTFYRAPSPESDPYVNTGDSVRPDTVVCIIEAMKVMNEIQAETSGRVVELLVENGASVEYGQALYKLRAES